MEWKTAGNMLYGLPEETVDKIRSVFCKYGEIEEAILYGSRAKGSAGKGSDIDLTVKGKNLNLHLLNQISLDLDDLLLPYHIDLAIYDRIEDAGLIDHIRRVGKVFYWKGEIG